MTNFRRRILVGVLAISLSTVALSAGAAPRDSRDKDPRSPIERIIRVIRHIFTFTTLEDTPAPPKP